MNSYNELEQLTELIENNRASLENYKRYEQILINGGLSRDFIFSYLNRAGFNSWEEFVNARQNKESEVKEKKESWAVAAIIGIGIGLLISALKKD
tara:strand:+ start:347 stop:631 length:285 start_codon:yes stop_codon:yes gene_type:complete